MALSLEINGTYKEIKRSYLTLEIEGLLEKEGEKAQKIIGSNDLGGKEMENMRGGNN